MKNTIGAIALIGAVLAAPLVITLVASAAFGETAADEQRAHRAATLADAERNGLSVRDPKTYRPEPPDSQRGF